MPKTIGFNEAFKIAQSVLSGRAEQRRQQSASATAFLLEGIRQDIMNQRQALRREEYTTNQARIQGEEQRALEITKASLKMPDRKLITRWKDGKEYQIYTVDGLEDWSTAQEIPQGEGKPDVNLTKFIEMDIHMQQLTKRLDRASSRVDELRQLKNASEQQVIGSGYYTEDHKGNKTADFAALDVAITTAEQDSARAVAAATVHQNRLARVYHNQSPVPNIGEATQATSVNPLMPQAPRPGVVSAYIPELGRTMTAEEYLNTYVPEMTLKEVEALMLR